MHSGVGPSVVQRRRGSWVLGSLSQSWDPSHVGKQAWIQFRSYYNLGDFRAADERHLALKIGPHPRRTLPHLKDASTKFDPPSGRPWIWTSTRCTTLSTMMTSSFWMSNNQLEGMPHAFTPAMMAPATSNTSSTFTCHHTLQPQQQPQDSQTFFLDNSNLLLYHRSHKTQTSVNINIDSPTQHQQSAHSATAVSQVWRHATTNSETSTFSHSNV